MKPVGAPLVGARCLMKIENQMKKTLCKFELNTKKTHFNYFFSDLLDAVVDPRPENLFMSAKKYEIENERLQRVPEVLANGAFLGARASCPRVFPLPLSPAAGPD